MAAFFASIKKYKLHIKLKYGYQKNGIWDRKQGTENEKRSSASIKNSRCWCSAWYRQNRMQGYRLQKTLSLVCKEAEDRLAIVQTTAEKILGSPMRGYRAVLFFVIAGIFTAVFSACSRVSRPSAPLEPSAAADPGPVLPESLWQSLAILKTGEHPLWFEFSDQGPQLIRSPAEAVLTDYAPWPHSRFCAGMLGSGMDLVLAINRDSFLIIRTEESGNAVMYRAGSLGYWEPYTIASVFVYDEKPAVLLYRDDFFAPPAARAPAYQVMVLSKDHPMPIGVEVPAFNILSKEEGWEVNALRRGPDNRWYYRFVQTGRSQPETAYYRTTDLSARGERTGQDSFRNSSRPEVSSNAPPCMIPLITAAIERFADLPEIPILRMISPELNGPRFFSPMPAKEENFSLLFGYFSEGTLSGPETLAFAIMPDGKGIASINGVRASFTLPALPESFVYTGAGLAGNILIAAWEEQEDSAVGAAGFMALNTEASGLFSKQEK